MGVLTQFLLERTDIVTYGAEIDTESVEYLHAHYPDFAPRLTEGDFLKMDFEDIARAKNLDMDELLTEIETIVNSGTRLDIQYYLNTIMDEDKVDDIYLYFKEDAETDSLEDAIEELGSEYSEEEIRLVRIKFISEVAN